MTNNWCHLRIRICLLILVLGSTSLVRADWIELVNGHKIEGDVLKQSNTHLLVDIGIEVLRIPVEQIRSRTKSEKLPDGKAPTSKSKTIAELPVKSNQRTGTNLWRSSHTGSNIQWSRFWVYHQ